MDSREDGAQGDTAGGTVSGCGSSGGFELTDALIAKFVEESERGGDAAKLWSREGSAADVEADAVANGLDSAYLSERVGEIVKLAMDGPRERIADVFLGIVEQYGDVADQALYAMCCGLAELIIVLGEKAGHFQRDEQDGFFGMEVRVPGTSELVNPDEVDKNEKPVIAGHRFVVTRLNEDTPMGLDLFFADPVGVCTGLAVLAGAFGRHARGDDDNDGDVGGDGG